MVWLRRATPIFHCGPSTLQKDQVWLMWLKVAIINYNHVYLSINISNLRHSTGSSEGHKRRDSPLFSRNLPAVLSSIGWDGLKEEQFRMGRIDWTGIFPLHFGYISILRSIPWHSYLPTNADYRVVFSIESLEPGVFHVCLPSSLHSSWHIQ